MIYLDGFALGSPSCSYSDSTKRMPQENQLGCSCFIITCIMPCIQQGDHDSASRLPFRFHHPRFAAADPIFAAFQTHQAKQRRKSAPEA